MQRGILIAAVLLPALCGSAQADVVLDGSTGVAGALSGPDYAITEDLGTTVGQNLFHSFTSFSLGNTETATFSAVCTIAWGPSGSQLKLSITQSSCAPVPPGPRGLG